MWNSHGPDVHHISQKDGDMNRVCAAGDCECSLDGCQHDGHRKPAQARFCSSACASRTKKANYRKRKRRGLFFDRHPEAAELLESTDSRSLAELHERARRPAHWADLEAGQVDDELLEHSDYYDVGVHEDEADETGIVSGDSPDPWRQADEAFAAQMEFTDAIDAINAEYERRARPYLEQQKRNPGPTRPELAALMRERDSKINELTRARQRAQALEWAARRQPANTATAHQRQLEQAAARAFATDLGRGRHLRDDPADVGRATDDIARW